MIPYGRQDIRDEDIAAVVEILKSDWLTQGPTVPRFEGAVARYCGAADAVAANSATSALHLACLALNVSPGDRVWTSPITFVASANCARYCGADVDFVDVEPDTGNLCPLQLEQRLRTAKKTGSLPKVVIPVHMGGLPCSMQRVRELADEYGFAIIEDASHAIGSSYLDTKTGSCAFGDITVFSFHPVKVITSGEGGIATTNDATLALRMRELRSHGICRDESRFEREAAGSWYYEQQELGYNYRLSDIHAALGMSQLSRLDDYVRRRAELVNRYDISLADLPIDTQARPADRKSAHHLYSIRLADTGRRRALFDNCRAHDIGVNVHYIPVHLQPYYQRLGFRRGDFPAAEAYYAASITLPLFPTLGTTEQDTIISVIRSSFA